MSDRFYQANLLDAAIRHAKASKLPHAEKRGAACFFVENEWQALRRQRCWEKAIYAQLLLYKMREAALLSSLLEELRSDEYALGAGQAPISNTGPNPPLCTSEAETKSIVGLEPFDKRSADALQQFTDGVFHAR